MGDAFRIGGWGMYPTAISGLLLLGAALLYLRQPSVRRLRVIANLRLLTLLAGGLGFVTGLINTFTHLPNGRFNDISAGAVVHGVGESLVDIALALVMLVLAAVVTTLGAWRSEHPAVELVDPHAG